MNEHAYGHHQGVDEITMRLRQALDLQDSTFELDELLGIVSAYVSYFDTLQNAADMIKKAHQ
jgi:hypothetical protein